MSHPTSGPKRLTRSTTDTWVGGVCGGLAEYSGVDATLIRIVAVVLTVAGVGTTILAYLAAWLLMPRATGPAPWAPPPTGAPPAPGPPSV